MQTGSSTRRAGEADASRSSPTPRRTFDRFRRLPAYVEPASGATQLIVAQIAAGWSATDVFERRFRQYRRFPNAESRARAADLGVCTPAAQGTRGSLGATPPRG